jgi:hypothetical protein
MEDSISCSLDTFESPRIKVKSPMRKSLEVDMMK